MNALPGGADPNAPHFFAISYGKDANRDVLKQIAEQTNGAFYIADQSNIERIFADISSEF